MRHKVTVNGSMNRNRPVCCLMTAARSGRHEPGHSRSTVSFFLQATVCLDRILFRFYHGQGLRLPSRLPENPVCLQSCAGAMKKTMKVILAILPVLAAAPGLLPDLLKNRPAVSPDYQKTVKAGTKAGQRYLENGPFETAEFEQTAMQNFSKHEV